MKKENVRTHNTTENSLKKWTKSDVSISIDLNKENVSIRTDCVQNS